MIHLSARLSWHDTGWNASVCQNPHLNAHCIVNQVIRENRDDDKERSHAGSHLTDLGNWFPPCSRDIGAYASRGFRLPHSDPLERKFLKPVTEDIPAYSCLPAPYRWMREENFRDVCEAEALTIRGSDNPEKEAGWVYEPDRQRQLLDAFWDKLKEGEGNSLIFYYVNEGNPVDENAQRRIVGVGRLRQIGPQLFFNGTDPQGELYPIWTRAVTQDYPNQGFRLPYQEYIQNGDDPQAFACYVPRNAFLSFSYVGEHVTDDMAVGILERLIHSVEIVIEEGKVAGPWRSHLNWLNDCLAEVWRGRGPFPGIGSVLQYLGCSRGTAFQRIELKDFVRRNENPWNYVRSILEGNTPSPARYADSFGQARRRWKEISRNPTRLELLDTLVRFELTAEQVRRVCDPEERRAAGINATEVELIANPYLICENDLGSATSDPIDLNTIDHGMKPEGDAALFIPPEKIVIHDDTRRVRAVAVAVLKEAAEAGDSLLIFTDLLTRIRKRFPDKRACRPDREIVIGEADFHRQLLWLDLDSNPKLAALQYLHDYEELIGNAVKGRVKRRNQMPNPPPDWLAALQNTFGKPTTDREVAALAEKATALATMFEKKISVLTGSAGTGKTSALKVFLNELERLEGKKAVYLLAPTGKARVRLSSKTKRNAFTIHQLLYKCDWFLPNIFVLKRDGGGHVSAPTVIIDECSMVSTDLLGTLFKALQLDLVTRLILVGDPNQLPPIGPGRPFVDIVAWLQGNHPDCVATLRTTMRIADEAEVEPGESKALAFADGYRSDSINPGDDEILSAIAQGQDFDDLEVHFWRDQDELKRQLKGRMQSLLDIGEDGDYKKFNKSLGLTDQPYKQPHWKDAERWQILSPLRNQAFGTDELNRFIQHSYKRSLIINSQQPWTKTPPPFGEQEIVYTDKVMQIYNRRHWGWPRNTGLDYVANGEIGLVTTTGRSNEGSDYLQVGFSTQDGVTYRYYRGEVEANLELAYTLTVHKAQGSDFDYVFLIIPQEAMTLSRELIYTGLTRFRKRLILLVEKDTGVLERLRRPEYSHTHSRNTNLFELSLRADPEHPDIPYPEHLIHRTKGGVLMRSKSEVIVADMLDDLKLTWAYEQKLSATDNERDFRLPDFTIGYQGDIYYWEHLGMLNSPSYREDWERKRRWYQDRLGLVVVGPGAENPANEPEPGLSPLVITSRDDERGGMDQVELYRLARKYILLEN
ncbi:MAG: AAA family ATPase [Anaerolineales bacterium]|nr:AAA family ATPase [Anaerolineales bacterium]